MAQQFLPNPSEEPNLPTSSETQEQKPPEREPLKHLLIGSPRVVRGAIHLLHVRGYAQVSEWSPLQPTNKKGEVMSMLLRYVMHN